MMKRCLIVIVLCAANFSLAAQKPNVVIFFTDDQGTLDANCYGSTDLNTPTIDGLARKGVRFTQAYSHTVCCPARAMLMTGRYPQRSNVNNWTQGDRNVAKGTNMLFPNTRSPSILKLTAARRLCLENGTWGHTRITDRRSRVSTYKLLKVMRIW